MEIMTPHIAILLGLQATRIIMLGLRIMKVAKTPRLCLCVQIRTENNHATVLRRIVKTDGIKHNVELSLGMNISTCATIRVHEPKQSDPHMAAWYLKGAFSSSRQHGLLQLQPSWRTKHSGRKKYRWPIRMRMYTQVTSEYSCALPSSSKHQKKWRQRWCPADRWTRNCHWSHM